MLSCICLFKLRVSLVTYGHPVTLASPSDSKNTQWLSKQTARLQASAGATAVQLLNGLSAVLGNTATGSLNSILHSLFSALAQLYHYITQSRKKGVIDQSKLTGRKGRETNPQLIHAVILRILL